MSERQIQFHEDGTATIVLGTGSTWRIQKVSAMAVYAIQASQVGKPSIPWVEVEVGGKLKRRERNPDDPDYKKALKSWENERSMVLMRYMILNGVVDEPAEGYEQLIEGLVDTDKADEVKFFWIAEQCDEVAMGELMEAISEFAMPTEEGIAEAEENFPGEGEREEGEGVQF
jgi:hypothetical protein